MVTVAVRDAQFNSNPIAIRAPPKIPCSFHGSGSTKSTPSANSPAGSNIAHNKTPPTELRRTRTADSVMDQPLPKLHAAKSRRSPKDKPAPAAGSDGLLPVRGAGRD